MKIKLTEAYQIANQIRQMGDLQLPYQTWKTLHNFAAATDEEIQTITAYLKEQGVEGAGLTTKLNEEAVNVEIAVDKYRTLTEENFSQLKLTGSQFSVLSFFLKEKMKEKKK